MASIKRQIRRAMLRAFRSAGIFRLVRDSQWRSQRLLILCYHGVSLDDEHLWRPALYVEPKRLEQRLEILKRGDYKVLPLGEALLRLKAGTLPPRSIVLTFDDGGYDFYARAFPVLKSYGFPVTVYQTTYYVDRNLPLFNLMCSYLLWKGRGKVVAGRELGLGVSLDLRTEASRENAARIMVEAAENENLNSTQKNELASRLATMLDIDYRELQNRRILQLMNSREIGELATQGVDFQLHTHRHRAPMDEMKFRGEICQNRARLLEITRSMPEHFCYPSGVYDARFLSWLAQEKIISATTCDPALASAQTEALLLPRFVDTTGRTDLEFESWLTGAAELLTPMRGRG